MAISEIEKLERRYQENPQGLTFAPLAEAYRKSGDPELALARLQPGLELHPDYIPASIVQGRCHLDMGNDAGAEAAFAHVLSLDGENVIALKALAEIAERGARFPDAERWLEVLLSVDRSNEGAVAQLARVREARAQAAVAEEGSVVAGALDAPVDEVPSVEGLETEAPAATDEPATADALPPLPTVERATEDARLDDELPPGGPGGADIAAPEPVAGVPYGRDSDAAVLDDAILGVTQLGGGDEIVLEAAPSTEYQLPSASEEFTKPSLEATSSRSEFQLPSASEELDLTPSASVSEYQLPSASDDMVLPDVSATGAASEYQLPDASSDLNAVPLSGTESNEFQAPDAAHELLPVVSPPAEPVAGPGAPVAADAPPVEEEPAVEEPAVAAEPEEAPGQWVTWADAALDPGAAPFPEEAPAVPEPLPPLMPLVEEAVVAGESVAVEETVVIEETVVTEAIVVVDETVVAEEAVVVEETVVVEATVAVDETGVVEETVVMEETVVVDTAVAAGDDDVDLGGAGDEYGVEAELVVTESMAELFLAQGHAADALRVYRQLLERRPGDERLARLVSQLEVETVADVPTPRMAASISGGTSVREMMRSVLTSRPNGVERAVTPSAAGGDSPGSPTRPAPDHLTLSAIFGDDASPLPPVMRPPARPAADSGVTFDEFYGTPARPASGGHERTTRLPDGEDDLDQFHDWLQNLKR